MLFRIGGGNHFGYTACAAILLGWSGGEARATAITSVVARTIINPVDITIVPILGASLTYRLQLLRSPFR